MSSILAFPASAETIATIEENAAEDWCEAVKELLAASEQVQKSLTLCGIMGWPAKLDTRCWKRFQEAITALRKF